MPHGFEFYLDALGGLFAEHYNDEDKLRDPPYNSTIPVRIPNIYCNTQEKLQKRMGLLIVISRVELSHHNPQFCEGWSMQDFLRNKKKLLTHTVVTDKKKTYY
jgi:hypothetical protein